MARARWLAREGRTTDAESAYRDLLSSYPDLKACWDSGRRRHLTHLELAWRPSETGHARLGVIVPKYHHTAVARNRLRRRLREIIRRGPLAQLPAMDLVVRARRSAYDAPVAALRAEVTEGVSRIT